jgi:Ca2+-binding RTX toxin-like protein
MTITVTGTKPRVVTVASDTTTTNTTFTAGAAAGTDRRYAFPDEIVAVIDAAVDGEGLELQAVGVIPHDISLTNNSSVTSSTLSNEGLIELNNKGGDISYTGAGDVRSYGTSAEAIKINAAAGDVTFNQTGGVLYADDAEVVEINSGGNITFRQGGTITGDIGLATDAIRLNADADSVVVAHLNGAINGGDDAFAVNSGRRVTVNFTGSIITGSGSGLDCVTDGSITYNSSGLYNVGDVALSAWGTGTGSVTINVTGGTIYADTAGISAGALGTGIVLINMTGGEIGSATQRSASGILAINSGTASGGDVTVTSTNVYAEGGAIWAAILNAGSTGDITVTANGTTSSVVGAGIAVTNLGTGTTTVTVQAAVEGVTGVLNEAGAATVINNGSITGTGGTAVSLGDGNDIYDGRNGLLSGEVMGDAGEDTLTGGSSIDYLDGGSENDTLDGGGGNDVLNGGTGADDLIGAEGNDTYRIDDAGDTITETTGIDTANTTVTYALAAGVALETLRTADAAGTTAINLTGNEFGQAITGNDGNNILNGREGNDTLTGNDGNDLFTFTTALDAATNVDTIADFVVADDTIRLENAIFTGLATGTLAAAAFRIGAAAADADDHIIYDSATGALYFDANGNAAGGTTRFAQLDAGLALTNLDFVVV